MYCINITIDRIPNPHCNYTNSIKHSQVVESPSFGEVCVLKSHKSLLILAIGVGVLWSHERLGILAIGAGVVLTDHAYAGCAGGQVGAAHGGAVQARCGVGRGRHELLDALLHAAWGLQPVSLLLGARHLVHHRQRAQIGGRARTTGVL
jgi:hypothetical protein